MKSIENKVVARIYGNGRGWSFSKIDFQDIALGDNVRQALVALTRKNIIRRVIRGVYDYPKYSSFLQETLPPDLDSVAHAIARKYGWRIQPSGNTALNLLGLSTQVPASLVYLSDGASKSIQVGNRTLKFKKAPLKEANFKLRESKLLYQALKQLGQDHVNEKIHSSIISIIPANLWPRILKDTKSAVTWIYEEIYKIAMKVEA